MASDSSLRSPAFWRDLLFQGAWPWLRPLLVLVIVVLVLRLSNRLMVPRLRRHPKLRVWAQATLFLAGLFGLVAVVLALPFESSTEGQLLSFFGILLSAAIALSSTTFLGNLMAGFMLRSLRNFRLGDFISVGEHFGRVSETGFFHTEVQTESRDLLTMPNLYLVTNPVRVVSADGSIVRAEVSIGYDVPRKQVEDALLEAAEQTGLEECFVSVTELGDYSISYRVAGLLVGVGELVSRRSRLHKRVLDVLMGQGIEICSPMYLNVRDIARDAVLPASAPSVHELAEEERKPAPETIMFDKAEQAASLQLLKDLAMAVDHELASLDERLTAAEDEAERARIEARRENLTAYLNGLREKIAEFSASE